MHSAQDIAVILVAAGRGSRMGAGDPKQYRLLGTRPVIAIAAGLFREALPQARILPVIHADDGAAYAIAMAGMEGIDPPAFGGATRQASVLAGLEALRHHAPAIVLIHDGARPFATVALVRRAAAAARQHGAAIPGLAVTDTIKEIEASGRIAGTPERARLRAVQTPQAFDFATILAAHRKAAAAGIADLTDDASVASWAGHEVHVFEGEASNLKITHPADFEAGAAHAFDKWPDIRTGQGFDVHAFRPGDHVWLGGVKIAHSHGLAGHSDADVLLHAITDAILGALADGDIGAHFPPSDPRWKGAASHLFLRDAMRRVAARGAMVAHLDGTLMCEWPKIGPHRDAMRAAIAEITGVALDRVAVKATTTEKLGFTGRGEGIAAMALATLRFPA